MWAEWIEVEHRTVARTPAAFTRQEGLVFRHIQWAVDHSREIASQ